MGKSLDSPEKGNVDKMSEKYRKNVRKMSENCPEGLKTQFSDIFWTIFAFLVDALFGDPVQCSPVTILRVMAALPADNAESTAIC